MQLRLCGVTADLDSRDRERHRTGEWLGNYVKVRGRLLATDGVSVRATGSDPGRWYSRAFCLKH